LPNGFTGKRASMPNDVFGVTTDFFAANTASVVRHIINPVLSVIAFALRVSTGSRAKANLAAWLGSRKLLAAVFARSFRSAFAGTGNTYLLSCFMGKFATAQRFADFSLMFWCNNPVLFTVCSTFGY
jgi:hypothetical protein